MAEPQSGDDDFPEFHYVKVEFRADDGSVIEAIWAEPLPNGTYRLQNTPYHAFSVSSLDIVEAEPQPNGFPLFRRVVQKCGHRTLRVVVSDEEELNTLWNAVSPCYCNFPGAFSTLISVDVPQGVDFAKIRQALISGGFQWEYADPTHAELDGE